MNLGGSGSSTGWKRPAAARALPIPRLLVPHRPLLKAPQARGFPHVESLPLTLLPGLGTLGLPDVVEWIDRSPRHMGHIDLELAPVIHSERHDERMAFFLDNLQKGRHEFRYVMYPELEGNVLALPASVWPMYVPSLKSESKPWQVKVAR